jgi:hypothetical protein
MRVTRPSPTVLVVSDAALTLRVVGVWFAGVGGTVLWFIATGRVGRLEAVFPSAICALFVALGVALVLLPRASTYVFDKASRTLYVTRRRLVGRAATTLVALRDLADVDLERTTDSDGGVLYRIAFVMADGRRDPWTSYYSSGVATKLQVVEAVRAFLSLPAYAARPAAGTPAPAGKWPASARAEGRLVALMMAVCLLFLGVGGFMLWTEQRKLITYRPIPVTVLATSVDQRSDDDGALTYRPVVTYRYEVGGRAYRSSRVTPLTESRTSYAWARALADRFAAGGVYTGWYDPARPEDSFLVRRRSVIPLAFTGIPAIALLALGLAARQNSERRAFST